MKNTVNVFRYEKWTLPSWCNLYGRFWQNNAFEFSAIKLIIIDPIKLKYNWAFFFKRKKKVGTILKIENERKTHFLEIFVEINRLVERHRTLFKIDDFFIIYCSLDTTQVFASFWVIQNSYFLLRSNEHICLVILGVLSNYSCHLSMVIFITENKKKLHTNRLFVFFRYNCSFFWQYFDYLLFLI